jgi:hypothetical protein
MQDEVEKSYGKSSSPIGYLPKSNAVRFRDEIWGKWLSRLLGKAQDGFQSALRLRKFVKKSDPSAWEKAKLQLKPREKEWIEQAVFLIRERARKSHEGEARQETSDVAKQVERPRSVERTRTPEDQAADLALRWRIVELGRHEVQLRIIEEPRVGRVVRESLSKVKNSAHLRHRFSELKRLVDMMLATQRGFESAILIKNELEAEAPLNWELEEQEIQKRVRELGERVLLGALLREKAYGTSFADLDELLGLNRPTIEGTLREY